MTALLHPMKPPPHTHTLQSRAISYDFSATHDFCSQPFCYVSPQSVCQLFPVSVFLGMTPSLTFLIFLTIVYFNPLFLHIMMCTCGKHHLPNSRWFEFWNVYTLWHSWPFPVDGDDENQFVSHHHFQNISSHAKRGIQWHMKAHGEITSLASPSVYCSY